MSDLPAHIDWEKVRYKRYMTTADLLPAKKPDGTPQCRWCGGSVPKGRRCWCGEECVHQYTIRANLQYAASLVRKRDKGVCALCGVDTITFEREMRRLKHATHENGITPFRKQWLWTQYRAMMRFTGGRDCMWDMDHIIPVVEGGGCCGLENYRTLCVFCHKRETAKLAKRRAKNRNPQMELEAVNE